MGIFKFIFGRPEEGNGPEYKNRDKKPPNPWETPKSLQPYRIQNIPLNICMGKRVVATCESSTKKQAFGVLKNPPIEVGKRIELSAGTTGKVLSIQEKPTKQKLGEKTYFYEYTVEIDNGGKGYETWKVAIVR